jgi:D-glycero-alpha-D-manno-heptose 1-phosphate guanylyltransferase
VEGLSGVTAAILAGGMGTRLRPCVADRPKVLADVRGRPFLSYLLDQLEHHEIRNVILCSGHLGEQVHAAFGDSYGKLRLAYSRELSPLGTAGALRLALPLLHSESVLIMNGDSFCDVDLGDFLSWHYKRGANGSLVLVRRFDTTRSGRVEVDAEGRITRFEEKGGRTGSGWINAGIYLLTQRLLRTIPVSGVVSLEQKLFPGWINDGLYGYQSGGCFLDIGTPETYALVEQFFATKIASSPKGKL